MIYKLRALLFAVFVCLACSCNKEQAGATIENNIAVDLQDNEIRFLLGPETKADVTSLSSFYVECFTLDDITGDESEVFMQSFTCANSNPYYSGNVFWPAEDRKYCFYASNIPITADPSSAYIEISSSDSNQDIVVASSEFPTYQKPVPLEFKHIMAKIGYVLVSGPDGYDVLGPAGYEFSDVLLVLLSPSLSGTYYFATDSWSFTRNTEPLLEPLELDLPVSIDQYIIPGSYYVVLRYLLSKDSYTEEFGKVLYLTFEPGVISNIVLRLPAGNDETPGGGVVIDPWEGGGNIGEGM